MIKTQLFKTLISLISGLLFGAGMVISGMVDPVKVIAFLNVTGDWDPSLAFVMGGALLVFSPVYHVLIKKRQRAVDGEDMALATQASVDAKLIAGSLIFGAGWGVAGFCPGPAITSAAGGSLVIAIFIVCMVVGMAIANYLSACCFKKSLSGKA